MIYLDTSAFIKLYLKEDASEAVHEAVSRMRTVLSHVISVYLARKRAGQYHVPYLDPVALHESAIELTRRTPTTGCRSLDILHVAAAGLLQAKLFVTGDRRQAVLGKGEGLRVKLL